MSAFAQREVVAFTKLKEQPPCQGSLDEKCLYHDVLLTENFFHRLFVSHAMLREHTIRGEDDDFSVRCQQREII